MEEKQQHEVDKNIDDVILPGFRFHPTDEELVGFYLKRRIQQAALPIELIKQVDIYKYDPWDLPKLAATGEREWYFYCPRDRKYRNSARPNRVTGAGFWKATGTDRPIYSSDGTKCVGLKKSLVFYRGRAAKGIKTDWMMHEFRLPSITDTVHQKKLFDRTIPINDSWVICRIFKKTNSMAQRALSYSWVGTNSYNNTHHHHHPHLSSSNISSSCCTTEIGSSHHIPLQTTTNHHTHDYFHQPNTAANPFSPTNSLDQLPFYKLINHQTPRTSFHFPTISTNRDLLNHNNNSNNFIFPNHHGHDISSVLHLPKSSSSVDVSSLLLNLAAPTTTVTTSGEVTKLTTTSTHNTDFTLVSQSQLNGLPISSLLDLPVNHLVSEEQQHLCSTQQKSQHSNETHSNQSPGFKSMGFPLSFPTSLGDPWKPTISWEETTPSCPSEMSTSYSSNKCYT